MVQLGKEGSHEHAIYPQKDIWSWAASANPIALSLYIHIWLPDDGNYAVM
jgi:hypothetical protein